MSNWTPNPEWLQQLTHMLAQCLLPNQEIQREVYKVRLRTFQAAIKGFWRKYSSGFGLLWKYHYDEPCQLQVLRLIPTRLQKNQTQQRM
jgi:hypothetical protein